MTRTTKLTFLLALAVTLAASCKKDKDNPTITVTEPEENSTVLWGEEVDLKMTFMDNEALDSYRVYLGDDDGTEPSGFSFNYQNDDVSGNKVEFEEHPTVPDGTEGTYYVHVEVEDEEGNSTTRKIRINFEE